MGEFRVIPVGDMERSEWLALRRGFIGGSDAAAVVGASPWTSPYALAMDKLGFLADSDLGEAAELGNHFERSVAEYTLKKLNEAEPGWTIDFACKTEMYVSERYPFAAVNLDGVLTSPDGRTVGYEGKLTNIITLRKEWADDTAPVHYQLQCLHAMAVRPDLDGFILAAAAGTAFQKVEIARDDDAIEKLMEHEAAFRAMLDRREVPAPTGSPRDTEILAELNPDPTGETELAGEYVDLAAAYCDAKATADEAERLKREAGNRLRDAMGNAQIARVAGYTVRRIVSDVPAHEVAASHRDYITVKPPK